MDLSVQQEFERCLVADLDTLITAEHPSSKVGAGGRSWNLPSGDQRALAIWGIPIFGPDSASVQVQLQGDVQAGAEPEFHGQGIDAYRLGTYWERDVVAVSGDGAVLGVWTRFEPFVAFINSSVAAFVEISWRWLFVRQALMRLGETDEDYLQAYASLDRFKQLIHSVDPAVASDQRFEWWNGICSSW